MEPAVVTVERRLAVTGESATHGNCPVVRRRAWSPVSTQPPPCRRRRPDVAGPRSILQSLPDSEVRAHEELLLHGLNGMPRDPTGCHRMPARASHTCEACASPLPPVNPPAPSPDPDRCPVGHRYRRVAAGHAFCRGRVLPGRVKPLITSCPSLVPSSWLFGGCCGPLARGRVSVSSAGVRAGGGCSSVPLQTRWRAETLWCVVCEMKPAFDGEGALFAVVGVLRYLSRAWDYWDWYGSDYD